MPGHRRFEVTARIHFEWQILVSDRHILGGLRQYPVELLPAEIRDFNATVIGNRGFIQKISGIQGGVIGREGTAVYTRANALGVMRHKVQRKR